MLSIYIAARWSTYLRYGVDSTFRKPHGNELPYKEGTIAVVGRVLSGGEGECSPI